MFDKDTCQKCGICLSKCPFIEMPAAKAREEITGMIENGTSEVIEKNCARCTYCDIICPTGSNPSDLRKEIISKSTNEKGVECLSIFSEEVPVNLFTVGMEHNAQEKKALLNKLENPSPNEEMFYLGCGISYGEKPPHRNEEILSSLAENMMKNIAENEELLTKRYVIKNGEIKSL